MHESSSKHKQITFASYKLYAGDHPTKHLSPSDKEVYYLDNQLISNHY